MENKIIFETDLTETWTQTDWFKQWEELSKRAHSQDSLLFSDEEIKFRDSPKFD